MYREDQKRPFGVGSNGQIFFFNPQRQFSFFAGSLLSSGDPNSPSPMRPSASWNPIVI
jgi:hypothetical protein